MTMRTNEGRTQDGRQPEGGREGEGGRDRLRKQRVDWIGSQRTNERSAVAAAIKFPAFDRRANATMTGWRNGQIRLELTFMKMGYRSPIYKGDRPVSHFY